MNPKDWFNAMRNFSQVFPHKHQQVIGRQHKVVGKSWKHKRIAARQKRYARRACHAMQMRQR